MVLAGVLNSVKHHDLGLLKGMFQYVVVDAASAMSDLNWHVWELADLIMVVLSPDITPKQAESFFRVSLAGEKPFGEAAFVSFVNLGVPFVLSHLVHPSAMALKGLARRLIAPCVQSPEPTSKERRGVLNWLRSGAAGA